LALEFSEQEEERAEAEHGHDRVDIAETVLHEEHRARVIICLVVSDPEQPPYGDKTENGQHGQADTRGDDYGAFFVAADQELGEPEPEDQGKQVAPHHDHTEHGEVERVQGGGVEKIHPAPGRVEII